MRVCLNVTGYILIVLQSSVALVHPHLSLLCKPECGTRKNYMKRPVKFHRLLGECCK